MAELAVRSTTGGRSLFGDLLGFDPFRGVPNAGAFGFEITRAENGYRIELPVAGFRPDQIEVTIEDRVLTIVGKSEKRNFTRTLVIPEEIDADSIGATVENGLLSLDLHVHPKAQPRKITIQSTPSPSAN
jgi:HSP20 family molecular chaperone IbpA